MRPDVEISADPVSGSAPLTVNFSAETSDPEGDEVTLEWNFGDGNHSTDESPSHVYTEPGTYNARVTATDEGGAVNEDSIEIRVSDQGMMCLDGRSDGLDGDELVRDRWTTVIREDEELRGEDGHVVVPTSWSDVFGAGGSAASLVV